MWNRKKIKERGKQRFTQNYWKALLAGLVLFITLSGTSKINWHFGPDDFTPHNKGEITHFDEDFPFDDNDLNDLKNDIEYKINGVPDMKEAMEHVLDEFDTELGFSFIRTAIAIFTVFAFFAFAVSTCIKVFLLNPLQLGGRRFYLINLNQDAELKELGSGFTKNYTNGVKTLFLRDLFIFLWSLLLVVPGIIKKYEYLMIPYLLAKNPDMDTKEAFAVSKQMMMGLYKDDVPIDLTSVEYKILRLFMENPGKVFTKQQIYEEGWGEEYIVADNNIMVCISKLRSKLDDESNEYIKTIRGLGYRMEK